MADNSASYSLAHPETCRSAQAGTTTWAGEDGVGPDAVTTGWTVEPMTAGSALLFGEALFLLALGTAPVHLALAQVFSKEKTATRAIFGAGLGDPCFTARDRAFEDGLAAGAPVLPFHFRFTFWADFSGHRELPCGTVTSSS